MEPLASQGRSVRPSAGGVRAAILCAFFVSGMSGLIYEVTWTRLLRHVMGNTTFSITTVLCAFMGGLALGSYVGGRFIDRRKDPLRVFAAMEGVIGLYCLLLPGLIGLAEPAYRWLYQNTQASFYALSLVRFAFCGLLLLIPATFMGATLPVLTRFFVLTSGRVGWAVARLYAINTFGAVLGASCSGFVLIPHLGVQQTIYFAVVCNSLVAITAYVLHRRSRTWMMEPAPLNTAGAADTPKASRRHTTSDPPSGKADIVIRYAPRTMAALLVGYGLSGAAALVYEIAWTRALSMMFGSSVYAFAMMLTAFILGLALGSIAFGRFVDRLRDPLWTLGLIVIGIGLSALLVAPTFGELPFFVTRIIVQTGSSFWQLHLAEFALTLAIMLIPTVLMGAAFPLASRILAHTPSAAGRSVGTVYAWNTLGSILGSFVGGFVLIPWLGVQWTIFTAVLVNVAIGSVFLGLSRRLQPTWRGLVIAGTAVASLAMIAFLPAWDAAVMSMGPFVTAGRLSRGTALSQEDLKKIVRETQVLYHKEGLASTITIKKFPDGMLSLLVNGKTDASSRADLPTQELLAHVPMLMHPNPRDVLVIGLASGITLGSAGTHPARRLDCAEIAPEMTQACRFFAPYNHNILDDPRVNVMAVDGRNHLALTKQTYDVIISEPSNPWIAGVADLFTLEFFQLLRDRLNDGGVACVWLEIYHIDGPAFRSVIRTFQSVFPEMSLWSGQASDFLMIGHKGKARVELPELERRMRESAVAADLQRIRISRPNDFLSRMIMGSDGASRLSADATIHTDDNALLEFSAARLVTGNVDETTLLDDIERCRRAELAFLTDGPDGSDRLTELKAQCERLILARGHINLARIALRQGKDDLGVAELAKAVALDPDISELGEYLEGVKKDIALAVRAQRMDLAMVVCDKALTVAPNNPTVRLSLAASLEQAGRPIEAMKILQDAVSAMPDNLMLHVRLAEAAIRNGKSALAVEHYRQAIVMSKEESPPVLNGLAWALATSSDPAVRNPSEALTLAQRVVEISKRSNPTYLDTLGAAYAAAGRFDEAVAAAQEALELAGRGGNTTPNSEILGRLKLYQNRQPFIMQSSP